MTFGQGAITSFSRKQKLNAKSSIEAELIGVDDALPQILWMRYFLEQQGYGYQKHFISRQQKYHHHGNKRQDCKLQTSKIYQN